MGFFVNRAEQVTEFLPSTRMKDKQALREFLLERRSVSKRKI